MARLRSMISGELVSNQLWESVAFLAKAAFLLLVAPLMIGRWGLAGYGEFALCNSIFVVLSVLEFGIRYKTRLQLCQEDARQTTEVRHRIMLHNTVAFLLIAFLALLSTGLAAHFGLWATTLNLRPGRDGIVVLTVGAGCAYLFSLLLLEPLIARGRIGLVKMANGAGWLLALPGTAAVVMAGHGVEAAVVVWLFSLCLANALCFLAGGLARERFWTMIGDLKWPGVFRVPVGALWVQATTIAWLASSHGLTLAVSALGGPALAGIFFALLRLSEIIGTLGAVSADPMLAMLARTAEAGERRARFREGYLYAILFAGYGAVAIAGLTTPFVERWLNVSLSMKVEPGVLVGLLGLSAAFSRIATGAALGLGHERQIGIFSLIAAGAALGGAVLLYDLAGVEGVFVAAILAAWPLAIPARSAARRLGTTVWEMWIRPLGLVLPGVVASGVILYLSRVGHSFPVLAAGLVVVGCVALANMRILSTAGPAD